jgi:L-alanine-DL-glutamate epimerase-like enolase superfamily enzyme
MHQKLISRQDRAPLDLLHRNVVSRRVLLGGIAAGIAAASPFGRLAAQVASPAQSASSQRNPVETLKISAIELLEVKGHHQATPTVDNQPEVTPLAIYDGYKANAYEDKPGPAKEVAASAIYLRIRTQAGLDGFYGPIDREAAFVVYDELRPFLIGKDALAGETLWDQMYRSNRHSRDGIFMMAISAVDNTLWDLRGRYYGVPVFRLLGGPSRETVEAYSSTLGFSLQPDAVRKRSLALKNEGFRYQKWFMGYGPGDGPEGMRHNVELVRILRETVGDDVELMFDSFSGWDFGYALEWAHQVEQYRPRWMEESTHPEKIESFATLHRSTTIPIASGEHFYGRWEVERYLQAGGLSVVQADPEWCGGISELLKIGTVASLHDVPVIPHGHSLHAALHVIFSQSPMTFPLAEFLVIKMRTYYHFEANPPMPVHAHFARPTAPGFGISLDENKIESRNTLTF